MLEKSCAKCGIELQCKKNSVYLVHYINNDEKQGLDVARCGDLYECPVCHCEVVVGLSQGQWSGSNRVEYKLLDEKEFLEDLKKKNLLIEIKR